MKLKLPLSFVVFFLTGMVIFNACKEDLDLEPLPENPVDSLLPPLGSEIYMSATIGGQTFNFVNDYNGYGNGVDSAWYHYCTDSTNDVLKSQTFYYNNFVDTTNANSIWFEFLQCSPDTEYNVALDSVVIPGTYGFGSVADTIEGVIITWIDASQQVWKSTREDTLPNGQVNSTFTITDVVQNYDGFSYYLAAGTFQGIVYDTNGNSMNISDGKFITRMGRDY
tara:strand:- start:63 stop:731 length:669 start_codon:yes stop_codon:yes gene_type:complete